MTSYIAQNPAPVEQIKIPQDPFSQYGLAGIMLLLILNQGIPLVKDSIKWFQSKDDDDDQLTKTLIQDLRTDNKSILTTVSTTLTDIKEIQLKSSEGLGKLNATTKELQNASQNEQSTLAALVVEMRSLRDETIRVSDKVAALHHRLDKLITGVITEEIENVKR